MKHFLLSLVAFAFVATFASASPSGWAPSPRSRRARPISLSRPIIGMSDNKGRDTPLYEQFDGMLKSSVMVFSTKKGNVLVILGFQRKDTGDLNTQAATTTCSAWLHAGALIR